MNTVKNTSTELEQQKTVDVGLQAYMNKVYATMSFGLMTTFAVAWAIGSNPAFLSALVNPETLKPNALGYIVMIAPLIMVFLQGFVMKKSANFVRTYFYIFSAVMGASLSWIFGAYTTVSITQVFLITAISFAGLSLWGYVTKKDISGWGSFLIMGLIGIIIASFVNIFIMSSAVNFVATILGILIFAGLTAYDTQKIKQTYISYAHQGDAEMLDKFATLGALELYLDFVNLMIHLLQIFGKRD